MDDQLLSGKRVLVIEDEMLVLMAIEDMLGDLGCASMTALSDWALENVGAIHDAQRRYEAEQDARQAAA